MDENIPVDAWRTVIIGGIAKMVFFIDKSRYDAEKYFIQEQIDGSFIIYVGHDTIIGYHPHVEEGILFEKGLRHEENGNTLQLYYLFKNNAKFCEDYKRLKYQIVEAALKNDVLALKWIIEINLPALFVTRPFPNWSLDLIGIGLKYALCARNCDAAAEYLLKVNDLNYASYCFLVNNGMFRILPRNIPGILLSREIGARGPRGASKCIRDLSRDWLRVKYCFYYRVPYEPTVHEIYLHRELTTRFIGQDYEAIKHNLSMMSNVLLMANPGILNMSIHKVERELKNIRASAQYKNTICSEILEVEF